MEHMSSSNVPFTFSEIEIISPHERFLNGTVVDKALDIANQTIDNLKSTTNKYKIAAYVLGGILLLGILVAIYYKCRFRVKTSVVVKSRKEVEREEKKMKQRISTLQQNETVEIAVTPKMPRINIVNHNNSNNSDRNPHNHEDVEISYSVSKSMSPQASPTVCSSQSDDHILGGLEEGSSNYTGNNYNNANLNTPTPKMRTLKSERRKK